MIDSIFIAFHFFADNAIDILARFSGRSTVNVSERICTHLVYICLKLVG